MKNSVKEHLDAVSRTLNCISPSATVIAEIVDDLFTAWKAKSTVYICGNGGSAATASHFVNDLSRCNQYANMPLLRAVSLTERVPLLTAWANDSSYEDIFSAQLKSSILNSDILFCLSCSGSSKNVVKAVDVAKDMGAKVILLTGKDGGVLDSNNRCDKIVKVPHSDILVQEDVHHVLCHSIARNLHQRVYSYCQMLKAQPTCSPIT